MTEDELLDLVDEKDKVIGEVWKSEAHKDPSKIHREVAVAIFNQRGEVLIQQRSLKKDNDPGEWKITAAGHVGRSEDPKVAIEREVLEEIGLKVNAKFYKKIFRKRFAVNGSNESRFLYIYYAFVDNDAKIKMEEGEVMDAKWIQPRKLVEFAKTNAWDVESLSHKTILELESKLKT